MSKPTTKKCPFCFEVVPFEATRCKACGASLLVPKKSRNYLTPFFFLTSVGLGLLCWQLSESVNEKKNEIAALEKKLDKLESNLISAYKFAPLKDTVIDSAIAGAQLDE